MPFRVSSRLDARQTVSLVILEEAPLIFGISDARAISKLTVCVTELRYEARTTNGSSCGFGPGSAGLAGGNSNFRADARS